MNNTKYYITLKNQYNSTDKQTIHDNLINILNKHKIKPRQLHQLLNDLSIHSIYSYYKNDNYKIPHLYDLLVIAEHLTISIKKFFI